MGGSGSNPNPDKDRPSTSPSRSEAHSGARPHILVVEDNAADIFLIREAMKAAGIDAELDVVRDGEEATQFFDRADRDETIPCPALVLLDINLPRKQGGEVLAHLRRSTRCGNTVVIAVSTSGGQKDREQMKALGANGYFHKPSDYAAFMKLGDLVKEALGKKP